MASIPVAAAKSIRQIIQQTISLDSYQGGYWKLKKHVIRGKATKLNFSKFEIIHLGRWGQGVENPRDFSRGMNRTPWNCNTYPQKTVVDVVFKG